MRVLTSHGGRTRRHRLPMPAETKCIRAASDKEKNREFICEKAGRSGVIRTLDPHVPNVVRYQTALHSVTSGVSIDQPFLLHKLENPEADGFLAKNELVTVLHGSAP
jgi:hypothetical protein